MPVNNNLEKMKQRFVLQTMIITLFKKDLHENVKKQIYKQKWSFSEKIGFSVTMETTFKKIKT